MRPIDADQLLDFIKFDERVIAPEEHTAQDIVMMIQTAPTITPPPNAPLTLEQLREMDGEPVWTVALDYGASRWAFVSADCEVVRYFTTRRGVTCDVIGRHFRTYGDTWLAYRRKPEEGTM